MATATAVSGPEVSRLVTAEYQLKVLRCEVASSGYLFSTARGSRLGLIVRRRLEAVELLASVYERLNATGWARLPQLVRTSSGARFLPLAPKLGLVLTTTLPGRPALPVGLVNAAELGQLLAEFHLRTAELAPPIGPPHPSEPQDTGVERWRSSLEERSADLVAYGRVARHRLNPGLFDEVFAGAASVLSASADEALERLQSASVPAGALAPVVCAGEFTWSDLVSLPTETHARPELGFASLRDCLIDTRPSDLVRLLSLLGRATHWRLEPLWAAISAFERSVRLAEAEREFLLAWLTFPYDAWQIADQYFRNKLEVPHREALRLLTAVARDEPARQACVRALAAML